MSLIDQLLAQQQDPYAAMGQHPMYGQPPILGPGTPGLQGLIQPGQGPAAPLSPDAQGTVQALQQAAFAPGQGDQVPVPEVGKHRVLAMILAGLGDALKARGGGQGNALNSVVNQYERNRAATQHNQQEIQKAKAESNAAIAKDDLEQKRIGAREQAAVNRLTAERASIARGQAEDDARSLGIPGYKNMSDAQIGDAISNARNVKGQIDYERKLRYEIASAGGHVPSGSFDEGRWLQALSDANQKKVETPEDGKVTPADKKAFEESVNKLVETVRGTGSGNSLPELLASGAILPQEVDQIVSRSIMYSTLPTPLLNRYKSAAEDIIGRVLSEHEMNKRLASGSPLTSTEEKASEAQSRRYENTSKFQMDESKSRRPYGPKE